MNAADAIVTYLLVWTVGGALLCGFVATARNRSFFAWLIGGALFGVLALIYLALAGPGTASRKPCPGCAEMIGEVAGTCPHCNFRFAAQTLSRPSTVPGWPGVNKRVAAPCFSCDRLRDHDHSGTCLTCHHPNEYIRYWWGYRSDLAPDAIPT
jgi:hypothetical protein